jgi:hypothetical protein
MITQSPNPTKQLLKALVDFQKSVEKISKSETNPFFNNAKYANLSTVIDTVKPALNECGLAVIQPIETRRIEGEDKDGKFMFFQMVIVTKLIHESGEMVESEMILPNQPDPQKLGSLITYYRRYSYLATIGLAPSGDDDDGNNASNKQGGQHGHKNSQGNQSNFNQGNQSFTKKGEQESKQTSEQKKQEVILASPAQVNAIKKMYGQDFKIVEGISKDMASKLITDFNNKKK